MCVREDVSREVELRKGMESWTEQETEKEANWVPASISFCFLAAGMM